MLTSTAEFRFMQYAIERVASIFGIYFAKMQIVVSELLAARKIDGARVKELPQLGIPRYDCG